MKVDIREDMDELFPADGKIFVSYSLVGYQAAALDRDGDQPSAAKSFFDQAKAAFDSVRTGTF